MCDAKLRIHTLTELSVLLSAEVVEICSHSFELEHSEVSEEAQLIERTFGVANFCGFQNHGKTAVRLIAVYRTAIKKTAVGDKNEFKTATATAIAIKNRD